jgi:SAM-dependent methyltransferase
MHMDEIEMGPSARWDHVASFYDTYVQATLDIPFFLQEATKSSGDVLELMSGTGRVSIPLARAGIRLTCVDNAPEMLAILRQKLTKEDLSAQVQVYEMDVRELALHRQFDLVLIPFHSFGELISTTDQEKALARIYEHLFGQGRFICTLHNPSQRLRSVNGQLQLVGTYPDNEHQTTLLFWSLSSYEPTTHIVHISQFYEQYSDRGVLQEKRLFQINFVLLQREDFAMLAKSAGFKVLALYGDYSYAPFDDETSPYMIWVLGK